MGFVVSNLKMSQPCAKGLIELFDIEYILLEGIEGFREPIRPGFPGSINIREDMGPEASVIPLIEITATRLTPSDVNGELPA